MADNCIEVDKPNVLVLGGENSVARKWQK